MNLIIKSFNNDDKKFIKSAFENEYKYLFAIEDVKGEV